jgi:4-hydroxybenzoate polyprenyltransferase
MDKNNEHNATSTLQANTRAIWQLIRWPNLLLLGLTLCLVYAKIGGYDLLQSADFWLFNMAVLLITAAGYVINDVFDVAIDRINKPKKRVVSVVFSIGFCKKIYVIMNLVAITIGFYLMFWLGAVFVMVVISLFYYSWVFKKTVLWGNLQVAMLSALPIWLMGVFFDFVDEKIFLYTFFAFGLGFVREITKDLEDSPGDKALNISTLAISLGFAKTKILLWVLGVLAFGVFVSLCAVYEVGYGLYWIVLLGSFAYFFVRLWQAQITTDMAKVSAALKILMLAGVLGLFVIA